jgi:hypothetical protein
MQAIAQAPVARARPRGLDEHDASSDPESDSASGSCALLDWLRRLREASKKVGTLCVLPLYRHTPLCIGPPENATSHNNNGGNGCLSEPCFGGRF